MAHSNTSSELALRFGADRVCAWAHLRRQGLLACSRLSRRRAPLRRSHGRLALEDGLNTMEEVKACRAWRKALHRAKTEDRDEAAEAERLR